MTQAVSGFGASERILNKGEMAPVLANVLSFVGLPEAAELPRVNKVFQRATQELQSNVYSRLGLTQNAIVIAAAERDVSCEEELQRVWEELNAAAIVVIAKFHEARWSGRQGIIFEGYLKRLADLKRSAEKDDPEKRQVRMQSLLAQLRPLREQIDATNRYLQQYIRGVYDAENPVPRLFGMLEQSIACENVSERLRNVITERGLDSKNGRACLTALSEKQKAAASFTPIHLRQFVEAARRPPFFAERFIEAERAAVAAEMAGEEDHLDFWEAIMREFNQLNIQVLDEEIPHTSPEILRWLDNPANQERLDRIVILQLGGLRHIPSRIEKLRNLRALYCVGGGQGRQLSNLPPELGNLVHLLSLGLQSNLLEEIPEALRHLPELYELNLYDNRIREIPLFLAELDNLDSIRMSGNPIRVLPEEIYRAFMDKLPLIGSDENLYLDERALQQVPFSYWFNRIPERLYDLWAAYVEVPVYDAVCELPLLFAIPLLVIGLGLEFALGIPLLIIWKLVGYGIEPIVSFFRDEFNCDPMVDVEPRENPWAGHQLT